MSLSEFEKLVDQCDSKELSRTIYNASFEHAKVLVERLIKRAGANKEDILLASGELNEAFYGSLVDTLREAMKAGIKVTLAVLNPSTDLTNHAFCSEIMKNNGEVYKAKAPVGFPHFILVGDRRFRLETDHKQTKAVANFNNPGIGKFLKAGFTEILKSGLLERLPAAG